MDIVTKILIGLAFFSGLGLFFTFGLFMHIIFKVCEEAEKVAKR
jgi:hypothetical protein